MSPTDRARAALLVALAYVVALGAGLAAAYLVDGGPIVRALVGDVAATCVVFAFSARYDNSSFYDPYWSVAPPVIAMGWTIGQAGPVSPRALLVLGLVAVWATRLTWNWARSWQGLGHEDWRYVDIREKTGRAYWPASFVAIHMVPTLIVFIGCLPLLPAVRSAAPLGPLDLVAALVTAGAIAIEALADRQLRAFTAAKTPGAIMDRGLWAYSRHPNYFGEATFWWGLVLFAAAAGPFAWWHAAGALAITAMFLLFTIPMMERRSLARRPAYAHHQRAVSRLVPWFRTSNPPR